MKRVEVVAVRFDCRTGVPTSTNVILQWEAKPTPCVRVTNGITGYESFCLEGSSKADTSRMVSNGWWVGAGTPRRWDALYIHGIQLSRAFKILGVEVGS